ncbi:MAG TPA: asparagine synthase-related protein [Thermoanaerobaculia bacterium]|nr:asparagine synthase-related protein [Thermoanaerobaculia bacterium]
MITWERIPGTAPRPIASCPSPTSGGLRCLWHGGFIANRRDLELETGFAGASDADLLLEIYRREGLQTPRRIAGTFAWILWDGDAQRLLAARDRLGTRGLFFRLFSRSICLAERVGALRREPPSPDLNPVAVVCHIQGETPPPGETFLTGIHAVEPGTVLVVEPERLSSQFYWRPAPHPSLGFPSDEAYADACREILFRVTAEYAGPTAGITLSGGLDSTAVAAALRAARPEDELRAVSWISPELPEADESREIEAVVARLRLTLIPVAADQHWPLSEGIDAIPDTPHYNFYTTLWDATFRTAREHGVTTLFSGMSGDHLFGGGLPPYSDLLLRGRVGRMAAEIRAGLRQAPGLPRLLRSRVLGPIARSLTPWRDEYRPPPVSWLGEASQDLVRQTRPELPHLLMPGRRERLRILRDPLLPAVALLIEHQASRHGIELRHPLLDHRLFDFAAALPTEQTWSGGLKKAILRRALGDSLPREVTERPRKVYPVAIFHRGLREREQSKAWALMTDMRAAEMGFVDEPKLRDEYRRYLSGETQRALFWHTLTLEAWLRRYFPR